ncbi:hypothetical protein MHLP_01810 [Candidatus Mycoplasma haematolamae str. Purdue]|uniref:Uncharacterized protein n=1 Tax=Mycoplasma haematolamae (strain Purdue) TaxID=1212765 RepID=I7C637_MYCHA|nr:hypothetical protein [Candidatus Mycoplasma haematolamae]AFO51942.1 hypothetical protein MHLP_01810 [Candidatus Mycoplasma haematolamae str. Purdue]
MPIPIKIVAGLVAVGGIASVATVPVLLPQAKVAKIEFTDQGKNPVYLECPIQENQHIYPQLKEPEMKIVCAYKNTNTESKDLKGTIGVANMFNCLWYVGLNQYQCLSGSKKIEWHNDSTGIKVNLIDR